jgi:sulfopyruvate decarboxylase TPP-binding subunit
MRRYDALKAIVPIVGDSLVVTNLANTATEWRALRPHEGNLYFVGMGMVTSYAMGLALALPHRRVLALDGDGGILFDLSILGTLAETAASVCVIVFDNEGYVSTGKWASVASLTSKRFDIEAVARGAGLDNVTTVRSGDELVAAVEAAYGQPGPALIIAKVTGEQAFVGTSSTDSKENKYRFVRYIEQTESKVVLRPSAKEHGEPPKPDPTFSPVDPSQEFGKVLFDGLRENGVDFVAGLPCSGLAAAQAYCMQEPTITYVGVANEGTAFGLCAGAWLAGKKTAVLIENFGLFAGAYQILRGNNSFGIPTLIVTEYRGDAGDQEFFAETGEATEPMLAALRINFRVVRELEDLKPAIRDGLRWMNIGLRPYAVVPAYDLTRLRRA